MKILNVYGRPQQVPARVLSLLPGSRIPQLLRALSPYPVHYPIPVPAGVGEPLLHLRQRLPRRDQVVPECVRPVPLGADKVRYDSGESDAYAVGGCLREALGDVV